MNTYEQNMIDWGCPECEGEIELYNTNPDGKSGKYRCKSCGRDTSWSVGKSLSLADIIKEMQNKIKS